MRLKRIVTICAILVFSISATSIAKDKVKVKVGFTVGGDTAVWDVYKAFVFLKTDKSDSEVMHRAEICLGSLIWDKIAGDEADDFAKENNFGQSIDAGFTFFSLGYSFYPIEMAYLGGGFSFAFYSAEISFEDVSANSKATYSTLDLYVGCSMNPFREVSDEDAILSHVFLDVRLGYRITLSNPKLDIVADVGGFAQKVSYKLDGAIQSGIFLEVSVGLIF